MVEREVEPLLATSYFRVLIGDRELGFTEVSRLTSKSDRQEPAEKHEFESVVLRRALGRSAELYDWRRRIAEGVNDRRDVTIHQLVSPDGEIANSWSLVDAWPCRWSGPEFDARTSDVAMEELELSFADLVWHEQTPKQGG